VRVGGAAEGRLESVREQQQGYQTVRNARQKGSGSTYEENF
jgi:hypothetical protein